MFHDVLAILGLVLVGVGVWFVYPPAALIVVGLLLLAGAVLGVLRNAARKTT